MTSLTIPTIKTNISILTSLRALTPRCQLDFLDTKALAERQAARLLERLGLASAQAPGITEADIAGLSRLRIVREHLTVSGLSYWNGREWIIAVDERQSPERQRFTICHELKHVIDHPVAGHLYRADYEAERAADYFAGCLLAPKPALKHAFCNLTQDRAALAAHFGISQQALQVRLEQTRLIEPEIFRRTPRCARPISTPRWQHQQFRTVQMKGIAA